MALHNESDLYATTTAACFFARTLYLCHLDRSGEISYCFSLCRDHTLCQPTAPIFTGASDQ